MRAKIANLHKIKEAHATIDEIARRWGILGMINKVGDIGSESPVIGTVFEKIGKRHGSMRKAMHKQRFQLALHVMNGPGDQSRKLYLFCPRRERNIDSRAVYQARLHVKDREEKKGAEILEKKDSLP